ncbi:MAG: RNA ligase [Anaeroplasmataceae bacterium]
MSLLKFIKSNRDWRESLTNSGIKIKDMEVHGHTYTIFNYDMVGCKFDKEILKYCRGTILDIVNMKTACLSFKKFFNYGENKADEIDWNTARIDEKLDGSIIKVWKSKLGWVVSTNSMVDANTATLMDNPFNYNSFYELFEKALETYNADMGVFDEFGNESETYIFELCTPVNKVVVEHKDYLLYFIGRMDNVKEIELDKTSHPFDEIFSIPKVYSFKSIEEAFENARHLPFSDEGYVVVDGNNNRVKIKSPSYVAIHQLGSDRNKWSSKNHFNIVKAGEISEVITYYPELREHLELISSNMNKIVENTLEVKNIVDNMFLENKDITRKELSVVICAKAVMPQAIFSYITNRELNIEDYLKTFMSSDKFTYDKYVSIERKIHENNNN